MAFTPIETQEALDAIISARLQREKEKTDGYIRELAQLKQTMEESNAKYAGYDTQLAELQSRIKGYETASVKTRIALETGIPYELANRLTGETEEEIRADAANFSRYAGGRPAPMASNEPVPSKDKPAQDRDALKQLLSGLNLRE